MFTRWVRIRCKSNVKVGQLCLQINNVGYPLLSLVLLLVVWEAAIHLFSIPNYLLPPPGDVLSTLWSAYVGGLFWPHLSITLFEVVVGYAIGCTAAFLLGAVVAESRVLERIVMPYIVALQSMPKVALAPLLIVWFGFGIASKVVLVVLICFFPVFVNTISGLRAVSPDLLALYKVFGASRLHTFVHVKLPSAARSIFAGLQIAVVLALIGAVVGEFVTSQKGLGFLIQSASLNFDVSTMFAAIVSLALIGITASAVVRALQRKVIFWEKA